MIRATLSDRIGLSLMAVGLAANASLFAYLAIRLSELPERVPLHFNALGQIDYIGTAPQLFQLPIIGAITWLMNVVLGSYLFRRERLASYLLWSASVLVQAMFWTAIANIVA